MGKLLVVDGLDGSGKTTQIERLHAWLTEHGQPHRVITFPDYDEPSSALVKQYLAGDFGTTAEEVSAYAASSFYAVDRYASYKHFWESDYRAGALILAARYTTSNAIYQLARTDRGEWDSFLAWLSDYEYVKLGLPRPDAVCFLDMPTDVSQRLLRERYHGDESKKDVHERDLAFLTRCREAALYVAQRQGWRVLTCGENGQPLSRETVTERLIDWIRPYL